MIKQTAKNKLSDLVKGSNNTDIPKHIILKEGEELDTCDYDPKTTTVIRFVDFRKKNELHEKTK